MSTPALPPGIELIQRDWLSCNQILFYDGEGDAARVTLVDSGYGTHADTTVALVRRALAARGVPDRALGLLLNTHLHSDHCGGNAAIVRAFGCTVALPVAEYLRPHAVGPDGPVYTASDQSSEPFTAQRALTPGDRLALAGAEWQVHASPGHDPHSVILHCPEHRTLVSADALWEQGFGLIFPELEGQSGFQEQQDVLDLIATLDVDLVLPGHGRAFGDVPQAIERARGRLAALRADPRRNARSGLRVLLKYDLLNRKRVPLASLADTLRDVPVLRGAAAQLGMTLDAALAWAVDDLVRQGELAIDDGWLIDREPNDAAPA